MIEFTTFEAFMLASGCMLVGILMLVKGGNWTVDSSVYVAKHFGISPLVVGFTIVAFGTSLPELVISVLANMQGSPGIALGNVVGSNIANILLVIGVTASFAVLHAKRSRALVKDLAFMLISTIALAALLMGGDVPRIAGGIMIIVLAVYVFLQYKIALSGDSAPAEEEEDDAPEFSHHLEPYVFLVLGLVAVAFGAEFLVRGARVSASIIGVPEAIIALSVIAVGTSLPELSTSIIAARKGQSQMILGNIIGSNVFNILMIIGFTALTKPIIAGTYAAQLATFDIWLALGVSGIFAALLLTRQKIGRIAGISFLIAYVAYNIAIFVMNVNIGGIN